MNSAHLAGSLAVVLLAACQPSSPESAVERDLVASPVVARDASGNDNDGLHHGDLTAGVPGRIGTAYSFRKPGTWIEVPTAPELNPGDKNFLVSAWVKLAAPPSTGQSMDLVRKGLHGTAGGELKLEIVAGGRVKCTVKDAAGRDASKFGPLKNVADGRWHRVGCARMDDRLAAILDNRLASKRSRTGVVSNTWPLAIGSKYGREDSPGGRLDEVTYYVAPPDRDTDGKSLSLRRKLQLLRAPDNAVGIWHLDESGAQAEGSDRP